MSQTLVINHGEQEFIRFDTAIRLLKSEYKFSGFIWDYVEASDDFEILCEFLNDEGIHAEVEE